MSNRKENFKKYPSSKCGILRPFFNKQLKQNQMDEMEIGGNGESFLCKAGDCDFRANFSNNPDLFRCHKGNIVMVSMVSVCSVRSILFALSYWVLSFFCSELTACSNAEAKS